MLKVYVKAKDVKTTQISSIYLYRVYFSVIIWLLFPLLSHNLEGLVGPSEDAWHLLLTPCKEIYGNPQLLCKERGYCHSQTVESWMEVWQLNLTMGLHMAPHGMVSCSSKLRRHDAN